MGAGCLNIQMQKYQNAYIMIPFYIKESKYIDI